MRSETEAGIEPADPSTRVLWSPEERRGAAPSQIAIRSINAAQA